MEGIRRLSVSWEFLEAMVCLVSGYDVRVLGMGGGRSHPLSPSRAALI